MVSNTPGLRGLQVFALALLALGLVALYQTFQIEQGGGYAAVGPRVFPLLVSIGLIGLSLAFLARVTVWPDSALIQQAADEEAATHWPTVGLTLLLLVGYAFALGPLGYVVATSLFYPLAARVLGSTHPRRDALIGVILSFTVYLVFTRLLGVRLPDGILEPVLWIF
jgi:putative tricarboxylic transport membrane protein